MSTVPPPPGEPTGSPASRTELRAARPRRSALRRAATWIAGIAAVLVVAMLGYVGYTYVSLDRGLERRSVLDREVQEQGLSGDVNLLIMGLDSRLDLRGNPLPEDIYQAMHTGNETKGGMNTNVLMYAHIPADGSPATVIQIPRDDLVDYAATYDGRNRGKIKEAYDHAFEQKKKELAAKTGMTAEEKHGLARDAGRAAEIATVEKFLGNGIRINSWIEVTMAAFYELAKAVQPIEVCVKQDTRDTYSGADFKAGRQKINAEQAMAFVRQRREVPELEVTRDVPFTDFDRQRRQQAFMSSLAYQLRQAGTFSDPRRVNELVGVATHNIATDQSFNLLDFLQQAKQLSSGKVTFYTVPSEGDQNTDDYGWVNLVDVKKVQAIVGSLLNPASATPTASPTSTGPLPYVHVVNASGVNGAAGNLLTALVAKGYRQGRTATAAAVREDTIIEYAPGLSGPAADLAQLLGGGVQTVETPGVEVGYLRVTVGSTWQAPPALAPSAPTTPGATPTASPSPVAPKTVGSGGTAEADPGSGSLTAISGGGIPCVR